MTANCFCELGYECLHCARARISRREALLAAEEAGTTDRHATPAELDTAEQAGIRAFTANHVNAPGIDATIRRLIADAKVGEPRTHELFEAFSTAWQKSHDYMHANGGHRPGER
jgi:hypothetical protein